MQPIPPEQWDAPGPDSRRPKVDSAPQSAEGAWPSSAPQATVPGSRTTAEPTAVPLGFGFPVPVTQSVDPVCADAVRVYQAAFIQAWGSREVLHRWGYFALKDHSDPVSNLEDTLASAPLAVRGLLWGVGVRQDKAGAAYAPRLARYLVRESLLHHSGGDASSTVYIAQLTHLRSIQRLNERQHARANALTSENWTTRTTETFPPSPISNLVASVFPGRLSGEFVCSKESGAFLPNPHHPHSRELLEALNQQLRPALFDLWSQDADVIGRHRYERGWAQDRRAHWTVPWPRPGRTTMPYAVESLEPLVSPTLFQTQVFGPAAWYQNTSQTSPSQLRARECAMGLTPYRDHTVMVLQYPVCSVFTVKGELYESWLRPDVVEAVVRITAGLLAAVPGATAPSEDSERWAPQVYNEMVHTYGQRPKVHQLAKSRPLAIHIGGANSRTQMVPCVPVVPFEFALQAVDYRWA